MSSRSRAALDSICSLIVDCPHSTPFWTDEGYLVIRNQNIKNGKLDLSERSYTDHKHYMIRVRRAKPQFGDLIFTREAPMGDVCMVPDGLECCVGQRQVLLRPNPDLVVPRFLLYAIQSPEVQHEIAWSEGTGSTVSNVRIPVLKSIKIPLFSLKEQAEVASLLGALDDRITLLRETNATLEAIAQALFKSWFVDFDPVHAKQQGRAPEGMDEATAALFPDSFEESELGLVPKGWRIGELSDFATYLNGYAFKTKDWQETGHPVVKIGNVKPGIIDVAGATCVSSEVIVGLERFRLKRGDLLVGMTGYVGETGLVTEIEPAAYLNQRVGKISTEKGINDLGFVYCLVRNPAYKAHAEAKSHGSAQANVSGTDLMSYVTVLADSEVLDAFNQLLAGLICKILGNHEQAQTLATLRDTLLPRLISGQLRLPEAEAMLERVA